MPPKKPSRTGRFFKTVVKPFVDVPAWFGYRQLADTSKSIWGILRPLFVAQQPIITETFDQAMARMRLKETDIAKRRREFTRLMVVYLLIALAGITYTFYLVWLRSIHGAIASFAVTCVAVTQAFRYHFWLFQIKERRLGCTFRDWLNSGFMGRG